MKLGTLLRINPIVEINGKVEVVQKVLARRARQSGSSTVLSRKETRRSRSISEMPRGKQPFTLIARNMQRRFA